MIARETYTERETRTVARAIAAEARAGGIYCLVGGLGAGKTAFTKGFAEGLSIADDVTSPTFGIINEYDGKLNLYHFDVYRILSIDEMEDTGYEEYFYGDGVCLIEWADMIAALIPENAVWITITKDFEKGADYRKIEISEKGGNAL
ncbi:MAG: tRNA (adenosine(37)-N6)-threonylcarbamoyltransferase complex ATPase subunit type 1 TsaE [Clostridiales bacterium]|nr:tRNA (adenosine(37)-N6)-threonylcarbamoyltransferase complex ATPase subunit type 1 TsaE [Clostridiales bacterium]